MTEKNVFECDHCGKEIAEKDLTRVAIRTGQRGRPGWNCAAFKTEVRAWAKRIGVQPQEIHLRPMTRKWASCSSRGRLTFDTELLRQPAQFRTEVIVHELVHLRVPNHGRLFRNLVRSYLSDVMLGDGPRPVADLPQAD